MSPVVFTRDVPGLGEFALRPVQVGADAALLHRWVTAPRARFWQMQDCSPAQVAAAYAEIDADPTHDALLGLVDGSPQFLVERYDPAHDPVGAVYPVRPGDVGMHVLVGPADVPRPGFTTEVMRTVMAFLFDDPSTTRVVVEPDVGNTAVHALNARVGFVVHDVVDLGTKQALLSSCTRDQFTATIVPDGSPS
ncbi:GNAT family N-acetyltransferase [Modestobacter sp. I12A-02628]|uniref:Lysine N-acyltransferase MbtK n=1 Tax=Goekera deserti TaxID=2497753 RepID=A0A7K3WBF6_9ACTN|nr:GNAT family N-acetyltransferase [Goekera deserti]MPQ98230.1 GNAT family N-acetyltransferase [Goekera deserti]NDI48056.1 GNAT family N-acetyltransferase [Goekera deserti]NEL53805.1 acetyltransferase [Goekera deserti]